MSGPGPPALLWGFALILWAAAMLPLGEAVRRVGARWSGLLRPREPVERLLLDLYLAGAVLYVVGVLPFGGFLPWTPALLILGGGTVLLLDLARRDPRRVARPRVAWNELRSPALALTAMVTLGLFAIEVSSATGAATGNTFDASALGTFVGLTGLHHQLPYSLAPVAPVLSAYPQGTTAWLAAGQDLFGLPPARTALLVTPLFLSLAPLAGYVWGRRWFGSPASGAAFGLTFALLATWTRALAAGSNDFVFAFPLVLLLWAQLPRFVTGEVPGRADAVALGALLGYAAALNPTGPEMVLLVLPLVGLLRSAHGTVGRPAWWGRYMVILGTGALFVLPSLLALAAGAGGGAAAAGSTARLPAGAVLGWVDPLLFRPADVFLSPFPLVRVELAALLVAGAALAALPSRWADPREKELLAFVLLLLGVGLGILLLLSYGPSELAGGISVLANPLEVGILVFTGYAALAALPLRRCFEALRAARGPPEGMALVPGPPTEPTARRSAPRPAAVPPGALAAIVVAGLILLPGTAVTVGSLGPYLASTYGRFGNTTTADLDLLEWAAGHVPAGTRVLVAPGSAAQFLPAYVPTVVIVYPVLPLASNATYQGLVHELDRGVLTSAGRANLSALHIGEVAVTQNNTALWPPFDPAPLLADPAEFPLLFHERDAYVFGVDLRG